MPFRNGRVAAPRSKIVRKSVRQREPSEENCAFVARGGIAVFGGDCLISEAAAHGEADRRSVRALGEERRAVLLWQPHRHRGGRSRHDPRLRRADAHRHRSRQRNVLDHPLRRDRECAAERGRAENSSRSESHRERFEEQRRRAIRRFIRRRPAAHQSDRRRRSLRVAVASRGRGIDRILVSERAPAGARGHHRRCGAGREQPPDQRPDQRDGQQQERRRFRRLRLAVGTDHHHRIRSRAGHAADFGAAVRRRPAAAERDADRAGRETRRVADRTVRAGDEGSRHDSRGAAPMTLPRTLAVFIAIAALIARVGNAGQIDSANLLINGATLEVPLSVDTGADIPAVIQTTFGKKMNEDVPETGLTAVGDLTGPGLDAPVLLTTRPGGKFTLPPLHEQGDYTVLNIRLVDSKGSFVQYATPAFTVVHVVGTLATQVTIHQLTPDDLRARGITIDPRNYDVYDYNFVFTINGQQVVVPYPVIIDRRTHEPVTAPNPPPFKLPDPSTSGPPPRFQPPQVVGLSLSEDVTSDK